MRPLSYFIDTDFSRAVAEEYGNYLQNIKSDVQWLQSLVGSIDNYNLELACHENLDYTRYTQSQHVLFRLGLDLREQDGTIDRFREVLQEYS